jgi:hypothetical protein
LLSSEFGFNEKQDLAQNSLNYPVESYVWNSHNGNIKTTVSYDVTLWFSIGSRHFEGTYCLHLQCTKVSKASRRDTSLHWRLRVVSCLLLACLHLGIENWGRTFLRYIGELVPNYKASQPRIQYFLSVQIYLWIAKLKSQDTRR